MPADLAVVFPHAGREGGVERVTRDFLAYECQQREVTFVGHSCDVAGITHLQVPPTPVPRSLAPAAFRRSAARAIRGLAAHTTVSMGVECPPGDVYWVHSVHAAWLARRGDAYLRGHRVPSAARYLLPQHQVLLHLERRYFTEHLPRRIICTSAQEVEDLALHYDVPRELTTVVPNGYDPTLFSVARSERLRDSMRLGLGATSDDIVVLMIANEWHRKGLAVLLESVAATRDRRFRIDLVGSSPPDQYRGLARRLGIADRLRWHGSTADVAEYHAAADLFVLPTTYEPFGLVIIEAMASGLPVVTSRLAGAASAITPGRDGELLDDPRDVEALSRVLTRLASADERAQLAQAAPAAAAPFQRSHVMALADAAVFPRADS